MWMARNPGYGRRVAAKDLLYLLNRLVMAQSRFCISATELKQIALVVEQQGTEPEPRRGH